MNDKTLVAAFLNKKNLVFLGVAKLFHSEQWVCLFSLLIQYINYVKMIKDLEL